MKETRFRGTEPRIFSTDPDAPEEGRVFVWAWTEWFERIEGESDAVTFSPVGTRTDDEFRYWLSQQGDFDLTDIEKTEFGQDIVNEFLEQTNLYPGGFRQFEEQPLRDFTVDEESNQE